MQKFIVAILLSLPLLKCAQIHINESKEAIKNTIEQLNLITRHPLTIAKWIVT
ncbi:MAG: hypothetical protein R2796_04345 [Chitinophagaceae bacterium]